MTQRLIQVGTGGQGASWCEYALPPNVADGTIEVVAAVDIDEDAHQHAIDHLDLTAEDCYTDAATAFEEVEADCCSLVVPPHVREGVVERALDHDLDIIAEKPVADTMESAVRIAEMVAEADAKMGITMSHRFRQDVTTLRRRVQEGAYGPVDYLSCRYAVNARSHGWVSHLYEWDEHPMLIDGSIHHLDLLAAMADGECTDVYARTWNPAWSEFDGDPQALVTLTFADGTHATYEGANTNAVTLNGWNNEYLRAECRDATAILDGHEIRTVPYEERAENAGGHTTFEDGEEVPLDDREKWANAWLVAQFGEWLAGGDPMSTRVENALDSMAIVFAAIESAETGESVDPREILAEARET